MTDCRKTRSTALALAWWMFGGWMLSGGMAAAQVFDSGSDGSDGALNLTTPGTIDFLDPTAFDPPLDSDGDGVYHFTTVTVGAGVTLTLRSGSKGPVTWLASGEVQIDGILDASGIRGHHGDEAPTGHLPGTGGYAGGAGEVALLPAQNGNGPGGGEGNTSRYGGGGGGHAIAGGSTSNADGGAVYGNVFLLPLLGGSGGGGGGYYTTTGPGGGGAGGGALLIASSSAIRVDGSILADGGDGGNDTDPNIGNGGGGGSGGSIRLVAPMIGGTGTLSAVGGVGGTEGGEDGSPGRIRLEGFHQSIGGAITPAPSSSVPSPLILPANQMPVRVVRVGGVAVPTTPSGSFALPDVTINTAGNVTLDIEASGVPLGTIVQVTLASEDGSRTTVDSTGLAGTVALSTATASMVIPHGLTRFFVEATWTP